MLRWRSMLLSWGVFLGATGLCGQDPEPGDEAPAYGSVHEREFDFWIGEWDVNNRKLQRDGSYADSGKSRAWIRPILGGRAILEEWDGRSGQYAKVFGMSVRVYDPTKQRWVIVLNWPSPPNTRFSQMEGTFRHGRGEFFTPQAFSAAVPRSVRYTFSDGLADSCRWDMAQPTSDGGWRTNWIMEFSRRRSKEQVLEKGEPVRRPPDRGAPDAEARQFDPLLGTWKGSGWRNDGFGETKANAALTLTSATRGWSTFSFLDVEVGGKVSRSFETWCWYAPAKKWVARTLDDRTPTFFVMVGTFENGAGTFVRTDRRGRITEDTRRTRYRLKNDTLELTQEQSTDGGATWLPVLSLRLRRT